MSVGKKFTKVDITYAAFVKNRGKSRQSDKFTANAKIHGIPNRIYPFYETQCLSMTVSNVSRVSDLAAAGVGVCNVLPQHVTSAS